MGKNRIYLIKKKRRKVELILSCPSSNFYDSLNSFRYGFYKFKALFFIREYSCLINKSSLVDGWLVFLAYLVGYLMPNPIYMNICR